MVNGVYLSLLAGPVIPVPVPASIVDSLISARVTIATTEEANAGEPVPARSGFELEFTLGKRSPLETIFLLRGSAPPLLRVILVATINGIPEVVIDGFILKNKVTPGGGAGPTKLTLYGKDITVAMELKDLSGFPFPAVPAFGRVALLLAKYLVLGVVPVIIPPLFDGLPDPVEQIPAQTGTDFAYINQLAREAGYVFYVDAGPLPGANTAYWGPEIKVGVPQPALNLDMDAMTNVESISFSIDNDKRVTPVVLIRIDKVPVPIPVPIPDISLLNPPLGVFSPMSFTDEPMSDVARLSFPQALLKGLARKSSTAECVTAEGTLNVVRYGRLLKARQLVGVRGAGTAFDGLYYVKSVTHEIKRGEYKQSFKLTRNGLVSTVPKVPV
jgi:hypothetical protein